MPAGKYIKIDNQLLKKFPFGASGQIRMAILINKDIWKLSNILIFLINLKNKLFIKEYHKIIFKIK